MLGIKDQLKRENSKRKKVVIFSIIVMILMPWIVAIFSNGKLFKGWETYFAYGYVIIVDILLLINLIKIANDYIFDFDIAGEKLKVKDGPLKAQFNILLEKIIYVDVIKKLNGDFEIIIIISKGKRNKNLLRFNSNFVKSNSKYRGIYNYLLNTYKEKEYYYYVIKKGGIKKYYYLYLLFKNAYKAEFTSASLDYITCFAEEYNLS